MSKIPFTVRAAMCDAGELEGILAEALDELSDKLNALANSYHYLDRPLVAAALTCYAAALTERLEPDQKEVYALFQQLTAAMQIKKGGSR